MVKFEVKNRFTGTVQFTAEIECADDAPYSIRLGQAVKWAVKTRANLTGADLADAYLADANLADANLADANLAGSNVSDRIIDGGLRSDGYRFLLTRTEPGPWRVKAGCRNFTLEEATAHWAAKRPAGDPIGDETRMIIANMLAIAKLRQWPADGEERQDA